MTLVTGFLGAGKTTLVNQLLRAETASRVAVVENEFGDVGLDGQLVDAPRDLVYELAEGCVCCTVRDDLVAVFEELAARSAGLDHVLVETSGLATPGPVMQVFDLPRLRDRFQLDAVVTVVDVHRVQRDLEETAACAEQIATADLLLLNKIEGVDEPTLDQLGERLRGLNPLAPQLRVGRGQLSWEPIRGLSSTSRLPTGSSTTHHHEDDISSVVVQTSGELDFGALDRWLGILVRRHDIDVLRIKGLLALPGHPRRFVFHAVRTAIDVRPHTLWGDDPPSTRLVLIGRGLDAREVQAELTACLRTL